MTSIIKVDEIQNNAGTTTLAKLENGVLTGVLSPATGFRNRVINGDMRIDQRNAGAAVTANGAYPVDRFFVTNVTDGGFTAQQSTAAPTGFTNSSEITVTSADSDLTTTQRLVYRHNIEGYNIADLGWGTANAKAITLSFWVRSSLTGTFGGSLENNAEDRAYVFTYTISVADTWEYKTITIEGDTSGTWLTTNGIGIRIWFGLGVGPTFSGAAGSWGSTPYYSATGAVSVIGTLDATWYITGVSLEKGTVATPFEFRSIGQELGLCERYYQRNADGRNIHAALYGGSTYLCQVWLPTKMRALPTCTIAGGNSSGGTVTQQQTNGFAWFTASASSYITQFSASAEL